MSRRGVLAAGGILGLLGLGAGPASAQSASGQIGSESVPLDTLYLETLDGGITEDGPVSSFSTAESPDSVAVRDESGELAVSPASHDSHAVTRGQDVTWSGQHEFQDMPTVGGNAIVESDTTGDGTWTRFADGTEMQSGTVDDAENTDSEWNTYSVSFLHSFDDVPVVTCSYLNDDADFGGGEQYDGAFVANRTAGGFDIRIRDKSPASSFTGFQWRAVGRWF